MFKDERHSRRSVLRLARAGSLILTGGLLFPPAAGKAAEEKEVCATEDLMREHGVLRRILIVYQEAAVGLRRDPGAVDPGALNSAATLFREFGENYHERTLEEQYVFPPLQNAGGQVAAIVDVLRQQHQRGREITDYVLALSGRGRIGEVEPFADTLQGMVRMYESHAAREDTIVFPAWKDKLPRSRLRELAETFEEIEHKQFGEDGFEAAVQRIAAVEATLGLADLARFTAPPPPSG